VKDFHHPVVWASEPIPVRTRDIVRSWWKPAACVTVIAVLSGAFIGNQGACEDLPDFEGIKDTDERKAAFIAHLVPMVEEANREVAQSRTKLLAIGTAMESGTTVTSVQQNFVKALARSHGIDEVEVVDRTLVANLLKRVDSLPVSLVVAQAAIESGWGTSRFTRHGNNLFGMRDYDSGAGLVPRERPAGETFEVAVFPTPCDCLRAYLRNINTHEGYAELRELRARLRAGGGRVTGERLSAGLLNYSERGADYVELVRSVISGNELGRFD